VVTYWAIDMRGLKMNDFSHYNDYDIEILNEIIEVRRRNLAILEQRRAHYGDLNTPVSLINEINTCIEAIKYISLIITTKKNQKTNKKDDDSLMVIENKFQQIEYIITNLTNSAKMIASNIDTIIKRDLIPGDRNSITLSINKAGKYIYDFGYSFNHSNENMNRTLLGLERAIESYILKCKVRDSRDVAYKTITAIQELSRKVKSTKIILQELTRSINNLPSKKNHISDIKLNDALVSLTQSKQYTQEHVDIFYGHINSFLRIVWHIEGFYKNIFDL
jgi:CII-binding regulator of phage lambda lysogenization HflD